MDLGNLSSMLPTPDSENWYDVITKFKRYVREFATKYDNLKSINIDAGKYPQLHAEQLDLLRRGTLIKDKIRSVTGAVDQAWNWLQSQFGFKGVNELSSLGLPIIPIVVVVGIVSLLIKWIFDYDLALKKYDETQRLEQRGYSPTQAAQIIDKIHGDKGIFNLGKIGPVVFIAGLGLLAYMNRDKLRF